MRWQGIVVKGETDKQKTKRQVKVRPTTQAMQFVHPFYRFILFPKITSKPPDPVGRSSTGTTWVDFVDFVEETWAPPVRLAHRHRLDGDLVADVPAPPHVLWLLSEWRFVSGS